MESLVVDCRAGGVAVDARLIAEPSNRDISAAPKALPKPPRGRLWVLTMDGSSRYHPVVTYWSTDRKRLEAFAKARRFSFSEIHPVEELLEVPADMPRERSVTALSPSPRRARKKPRDSDEIVADLWRAGYRTVGQVADAGWDRLLALGLEEREVEAIAWELSAHGVTLEGDEDEEEAA